MKVFKILHLNIGDGSIVREIGTLHEVVQGSIVPKHNSPKCRLGIDDTTYEQHGEKISLKFIEHLESTIDEYVIDIQQGLLEP
jgi:hypothetical protein